MDGPSFRYTNIYIYILSIVKCTIDCCDYIALWLFVTDIGLNLHLVSSPMPSATPATPLRVQSAHHEVSKAWDAHRALGNPNLGDAGASCATVKRVAVCLSRWYLLVDLHIYIYLFHRHINICSQIKYMDRYRHRYINYMVNIWYVVQTFVWHIGRHLPTCLLTCVLTFSHTYRGLHKYPQMDGLFHGKYHSSGWELGIL